MTSRIPTIDAARCSGCGRCIAACHLQLFAFELRGWKKISVLQDSDRCSGCGKCAVHCPIDALTLIESLQTENKYDAARHTALCPSERCLQFG